MEPKQCWRGSVSRVKPFFEGHKIQQPLARPYTCRTPGSSFPVVVLLGFHVDWSEPYVDGLLSLQVFFANIKEAIVIN